MEWWQSFILVIGSVLFLISIGVPVVFAFLAVDIVALTLFMGVDALWTVATSSYTSIASYNLAPIGLFMLMGEALYHTGMVDVVMDVVDKWLGNFRARYYIVVIVSGTILGAMTGVAMAVVAMLGVIMAPQMIKRGYSKKLTLGVILSSGTMAAIIPPSSLAVLYGSLAQVSIAGMLVGGVIPGCMIAFFYIAYILIRCKMNPGLVPPAAPSGISFREKLRASIKLLPCLVIIFSVVGLITLGICTPTEAAAAGALSCYLVGALFGKLRWAVIKASFVTTIKIFGIIYFIFVGSTCFSQLLAITGIAAGFADFASSLKVNPILLFLVFQGVVWILGMIIDQVSIMMITIPIFTPIIIASGLNPLHFGIVFLVNSVVGGKTPPFGLMGFTLASAAKNTTVEEVFKAVLPFLALDACAIALMIVFPKIILFLPMVSGIIK